MQNVRKADDTINHIVSEYPKHAQRVQKKAWLDREAYSLGNL